MTSNPSVPYENLPFLPPPLNELETKEILKLCVDARVALEHLKMTVETSPHRNAILATIPVLETRYSCAVDGIDTKIYDLFLYRDKYRYAPPKVMQVLRCGRALKSGQVLLDSTSFDQRLAKELCARVNGFKFFYRTAGELESSDESYPVLYSPPQTQKELFAKLDNWEKFINNEHELDPLIVMALGAYQFEAVRPFTQGSGKTGRILNQLFLVNRKIIDAPYLCLSRHLVKNREDYCNALMGVCHAKDWASYLKFMLNGLIESAEWTANKVKEIDNFQMELKKRIDSDPALKKINSTALGEILSINPFLRIKQLVDAELVRRKTSSKYLNLLNSKGILEKIQLQRGDIFVNQPYVEMLIEED